MRRFFGILALCTSVALVGAAPTASPSPTPRPLATPTSPTATFQPTVVIFSFEQTAGMPADTGKTVADIYAQAIASAPGIGVAGVGLNVSRADYLTYAQSKKADFYISGYLTPVGSGASIVEQIVDVNTGIIVFSQTAEVFSAPETETLALNARAFMMARSGVGANNVGAGDTSTPAPSSTSGSQVSIGSLFHRTPKGSTPTPVPSYPPKPSRGMFVLRVSGTAPADDLASATTELNAALAPYFNTQTPAIAVTNITTQADSICGTNRDNTIVTGTLAQSRVKRHTVTTFTFDVYACFGAKLYETIQSDNDRAKAINAAVSAYQTAHPDNG